MAQAVEPPPVKLIMGLILAREAPIVAIRQQLEAVYGRIDLETETVALRGDTLL